MIKLVDELVPGDVICLGLRGPQMIVILKPVVDGLAIICDCGEKAILTYDCEMYVYCNRDEELQLAREQLEIERKRQIAEQEANRRRVQAKARRDQELIARGKRDSEMWYGIN